MLSFLELDIMLLYNIYINLGKINRKNLNIKIKNLLIQLSFCVCVQFRQE